MIRFLVDEMIKSNIISEEEQESYIYGLTIWTEKVITFCTLILVLFAINKLVPGLILIVSFLLLRERTGGFHLPSFFGCFVGTILLIVLSVTVIAPVLESNTRIALVLLILSVISILVFTPVNHPNLDLTAKEKRQCRIYSLKVLAIEVVGVLIGYLLDFKSTIYIVIGIVLCALLIIIAKIIGQEVKTSEGK